MTRERGLVQYRTTNTAEKTKTNQGAIRSQSQVLENSNYIKKYECGPETPAQNSHPNAIIWRVDQNKTFVFSSENHFFTAPRQLLGPTRDQTLLTRLIPGTRRLGMAAWQY
jgi:hypothetical protein